MIPLKRYTLITLEFIHLGEQKLLFYSSYFFFLFMYIHCVHITKHKIKRVINNINTKTGGLIAHTNKHTQVTQLLQ